MSIIASGRIHARLAIVPEPPCAVNYDGLVIYSSRGLAGPALGDVELGRAKASGAASIGEATESLMVGRHRPVVTT